MDVEPQHIHKMIYLPTPFVGIFLEQEIMPADAWTRLRGVIVDGGHEVDSWPKITLMKKMGDEKYPLDLLQPTMTLDDGDLLRHCHYILTQHLLGLEPALQRVHGSLIATHIR